MQNPPEEKRASGKEAAESEWSRRLLRSCRLALTSAPLCVTAGHLQRKVCVGSVFGPSPPTDFRPGCQSGAVPLLLVLFPYCSNILRLQLWRIVTTSLPRRDPRSNGLVCKKQLLPYLVFTGCQVIVIGDQAGRCVTRVTSVERQTAPLWWMRVVGSCGSAASSPFPVRTCRLAEHRPASRSAQHTGLTGCWWGCTCQSSGAVSKSRWTSRAPVPNKPKVSVDVKQHFNQPTGIV